MRSATSAQHKHNVKDLTDYMKTKYRAIIEKGQTHDTDDYVRDIYKALKTVPNPAFKNWVVEDMQQWELGHDRTPDGIISEAVVLYNNSVEDNKWATKDPKEAKLVSLVTRFESILTALATNNAPSGNNQSGGRDNSTSKTIHIADWRKKKGAATVTRDGKEWWWCPDHKKEGDFDGLYVTHKPGDGHEEWEERKKAYREQRRDKKEKSGENGETKNKNSGGKLSLSDAMKKVMTSKMNCSAAEFRKLMDDAKALAGEDF